MLKNLSFFNKPKREVKIMNQIYKKENFIVVPVGKGFLVININKVFKAGHTHIKELPTCRMLIDLALRKELPRNPYYADNLIRISMDKEYIKELQEFKEDSEDMSFKRMMQHDSYRRVHGAIKRVR